MVYGLWLRVSLTLVPYMAKVHKSVGFGTRSADARDNPFLPNNEAGLLLSHQPRCQAEQHGIGESVNLDSMAIEKV